MYQDLLKRNNSRLNGTTYKDLKGRLWISKPHERHERAVNRGNCLGHHHSGSHGQFLFSRAAPVFPSCHLLCKPGCTVQEDFPKDTSFIIEVHQVIWLLWPSQRRCGSESKPGLWGSWPANAAIQSGQCGTERERRHADGTVLMPANRWLFARISIMTRASFK